MTHTPLPVIPRSRAAAYGAWVQAWRWPVLLLCLTLTLLAASGARFLQPENDARIWFGPDNPQRLALEALENTFNKTDTVYIAVAPHDGDVFSVRALRAQQELTAAAWQLPHASRVNSITNYQYTRADGDELFVGDLVAADPAELDAQQRARIRAIALNEPLLVQRLLSTTGDVAAISVIIVRPGVSADESTYITRHARQMLDELQARYPDIDFHLTGGIPFDAAFGEATEHDLRTFVPAMLAVLALTMAVLLRSLAGTLATLLVIGLSSASAMGLGGWAGLGLNPATGIAPTIILTLAVADSIHLLTGVFQYMAQGGTKFDAIRYSLHLNMQPVAITSVTTTIGFLSMNFSDAPPFHDLGNLVATGVMAAWLFSVSFLPALLAILPLRVTQRPGELGFRDRLGDWVIRRRRVLLAGMTVLTLALMTGIPRIDLNDNFLEYLAEDYPVRQATRFVQDHVTGMDAIDYSLAASGSGGINDPAYLASVEAFAQWYRQQPGVMHVNVITDVMKRLNQNMHADDPAWYALPEQRELAAQYLLLYEMSLPYGQDLNNRISVDKSVSRMTVILKDQTARAMRDLDARARDWLMANAPPTMLTHGAGLSIMFAHVSKTNIDAMLSGSLLALLLISLLLVLALRSLRFGLLSLIPNLTPAFMGFGVWGYGVAQIGLASAVIVALTLGIVVDDTVHFLSKYLRARRESGLAPEAAVRYAFHTVGTAMTVTTLVLVAGFGTLALSGYKVNADMGLLAAITVGLALVLDFLLLPPLILKLDKGA